MEILHLKIIALFFKKFSLYDWTFELQCSQFYMTFDFFLYYLNLKFKKIELWMDKKKKKGEKIIKEKDYYTKKEEAIDMWKNPIFHWNCSITS